MINHAAQDTSAFDRAKAGSNPTNERNDTPRPTNRRIEIGDCSKYGPKTHKMAEKQTSRRKFLERSLKTGLAIIAGASFLGKTRIAKASDVLYNNGRLETQNYVYNTDFIEQIHYTVHYPEATEEYGLYDQGYDVLWGPFTKKTKIVSVIPGHELFSDARPLESFTPVNLELSLHEKAENLINVLNLKNELKFKLPWASPPDFADFSPKPITLWRGFPAEPDKLQFLADIREACAKQGGTGIVPLSDLNGEYASQVPYDFLQVRFDVYPGNLNFSLDSDGKILDGKVDLEDYARLMQYWGWQRNPENPEERCLADISGPQGVPDGKVDMWDLALFMRDWLKNIRDIMP